MNKLATAVGIAENAAQTPGERIAAEVAIIEKPIVEAVVTTAAKAMMRENVEISSPTSDLDALCPPDK